MTCSGNPRPRIAMISRAEALASLASAPPEGLTAKEVYFAARPPTCDVDHAISGSSYAHRTLEALVDEGLVEKCGLEARPRRFRAKAGMIPREADGPPMGRPAASPERSRRLAAASAAPVAGPSVGPRPDRPADNGPDRIADALLRMLQAPKPGSRAEIVKIQAAEGISWARAAGLDDLAIAAEIVAATGLAASPGEIVHLVAGMPTRADRMAS